LDVGSNSVHLEVADVEPGGPLRTVASAKHRTRLAEAIDDGAYIAEEAVAGLVAAVVDAVGVAGGNEMDELITFATSAVRGVANRRWITARVSVEAGIQLGCLGGRDEARLTFVAARAWYGLSAGPMLLLDIGGGSLEIAYGEVSSLRTSETHVSSDPPRVPWRLDQKGRSSTWQSSPPTRRSCAGVRCAWSVRPAPVAS
jgi:exopolyphosphatase/guanosine-5'-triphosphate,3'-diphosphate pyrophosphatase